MRRAVAAVAALVTLAACASTGGTPPTAQSYAPALGIELDAMQKEASGLYYRDVREGSGPPAKRGDRVAFHYTGFLPDGTQFDASRPGPAIEIRLGDGKVIRGMEQGLLGMRAGGIRKIVVPPELGYGNRSVGDVPGDATLVFQLELLRVR